MEYWHRIWLFKYRLTAILQFSKYIDWASYLIFNLYISKIKHYRQTYLFNNNRRCFR